MTLREAGYLLIMIALGLRVARDMIALHRWSPSLFLRGLVVLRDTRQLSHVPREIFTPAVTTGTFYKAEYRPLGLHQVLFTAQTFNAPCLLGVLELTPEAPALAMSLRLHWSFYALFLVGLTIAGFPWFVLALMIGMCLVNYWWEVRECRRLFRLIGDAMERSPGEVAAGAHGGA